MTGITQRRSPKPTVAKCEEKHDIEKNPEALSSSFSQSPMQCTLDLLWGIEPGSQSFSYAEMEREEALAKPHDACRWLGDFRDAGDGTANPNMFVIRKLRQLIWLQTERAIREENDAPNDCWRHTKCVDRGRHPPMHSDTVHRDHQVAPQLKVEVIECDILERAEQLHRNGEGYSVAVLNMASPHSPGGGFRSGAGAQEENLFRRSNLFNFLHPRQYPIKDTACLVSPGVTILRGKEQDGYPFLEKPFPVTVLTCAALQHPQLTPERKYKEREKTRMRTKIRALLDGAKLARCDACIFSAFGCGAFGNPPEEVASLFKEELRNSGLKQVSFCIFNDHNSGRRHNPRGNFTPFQEIFRDLMDCDR